MIKERGYAIYTTDEYDEEQKIFLEQVDMHPWHFNSIRQAMESVKVGRMAWIHHRRLEEFLRVLGLPEGQIKQVIQQHGLVE